MAEVQKISYVESFMDFDDACMYLDRHLVEHGVDWDIEDAGIGYVNHLWRAGAIFVRKNERDISDIENALKNLTTDED